MNVADEAQGAARAAARLHTAHLDSGHASHMLVGYERGGLPGVESLMPRGAPWRAAHRLIGGLEEVTGLQYLLQPWKRALLRHPLTREAEVVNLHNLHGGYFPIRALPELGRAVPLVWTLHDLWGLTGHCGFPDDHACERWTTGCGRCPSLESYPRLAIDTTAFLWRRKAAIYGRTDLTIVTPSRWLARAVERSPLLGRFRRRVVPHGVDTAVFSPTPRQEAREALGLPRDAELILFSAFDPFLERKGGAFLFDVLRRLWEEGRSRLALVMVGCQDVDLAGRVPVPVHNLGLIRDERSMALAYSAADVYAGPSLSESFGLVFLESLACGTPVIAFQSTAVPEVVRHEEDGYLARARDGEDLLQGLRGLLDDPVRRVEMGRRGRERVVRERGLAEQARRYVELYEETLERRAGRGAR